MAATVETDVAIIGAGPVGLFAVFECGMLRMRCAVIDALDAIGGQCTALYPEKPIYDIPAHPAIDAAALIERLERQAAPFTPLYMLARREEFAGKRVVIAGGGDSAVDWALSLKGIAQVTMVHRRPKFRAAPESVARLEAAAAAGEVEMAIPYQLHALEGDGSRLTGVVLSTLKGETRVVPADHLLAFYGLSMELGPVAAWGLDLDRHHVAVAPATCETS